MYILGVSCYYHDSSAALLRDGVVVAAVEEERFTRKKHDTSFPINSIKYCLDSQGITIDDIDHVGFHEKQFFKFECMLYQYIEYFPKSMKVFLSSIPSWLNEKLRVTKALRKKLKYKGEVMFIEHHIAHAASTFLVSPFKKAAILTIDGVGEWTTTAYGIGDGNKIDLLKEIRFPHSIGLLYSTITAYLGFSVNNSEYKVMGLAPYGDMNRDTNPYYNRMRKVIDIKDDGSYRLDMSYFVFDHKDRMPSKKMCKLFGGPISARDVEMSKRHKDIAAAVQLVTEDVVILMLRHVHKVTKCDNIVMAGGVALNSVCNGKILRNTPFKKIWIQPNSSDGGTSMGVACYINNVILDNKRNYQMKDAYLGPKYSTEQVKSFLDQYGIKYS
ncbi:MAG: hypothetical protein KAJ47_01725, partial [Candidatus Aenigmarchaeota archaeon]|nr:hypothetical protein [Candidatus Aenigmarchaeota archaeon]